MVAKSRLFMKEKFIFSNFNKSVANRIHFAYIEPSRKPIHWQSTNILYKLGN